VGIRYVGLVPTQRLRFDAEDASNTLYPDIVHETQIYGKMEITWALRSQVYMAGGRGWWSVGDRCNIVWNDGIAAQRLAWTWLRRTLEGMG
jgi:hypothetical protein